MNSSNVLHAVQESGKQLTPKQKLHVFFSDDIIDSKVQIRSPSEIFDQHKNERIVVVDYTDVKEYDTFSYYHNRVLS